MQSESTETVNRTLNISHRGQMWTDGYENWESTLENAPDEAKECLIALHKANPTWKHTVGYNHSGILYTASQMALLE